MTLARGSLTRRVRRFPGARFTLQWPDSQFSRDSGGDMEPEKPTVVDARAEVEGRGHDPRARMLAEARLMARVTSPRVVRATKERESGCHGA